MNTVARSVSTGVLVGMFFTAVAIEAQTREGFETRVDDGGERCAVYLQQPVERLESIKWSGKCDSEHLANGPGTLSLFFAGVHESDTVFGNTGVVMEHGYARADLPKDDSIQMKMENCGLVKVAVKGTVQLQRDDVAQRILMDATHVSKQRCPTDGVTVCIYYQGHEPAFDQMAYWTQCPVFWQLDRNQHTYNFDGYQNQPATSERHRIDDLRAGVMAQRVERRRQAAAAKAATDRQAAANEAQRRKATFAAENGVTEFPTVDALKANPFRFQGKVVAIVQSFDTMLTANRALLSDVVIDDVPTGLFTGKETVILAMRVLGNIPVKTALGGQVLVPHGKYVALIKCKSSSCEDVGMR